jgi:hypothetical protein
MYHTLDTSEKSAAQASFSTPFSATTGALSVLEQLQDEVRLSEFIAKREKERRQQKLNLLRIVPLPNTKKAKKARRKAKSTPPMLWLKDLICSLVFGEKTAAGVRPSLEKKELIGLWNQNLQLPKLANYRLDDHFKGVATYYFFGNGDPKDNLTLVMIDIDVRKSKGLGTPQGALAFAEHLRRVRFPGLYFERSTGGSGIHGYILVRKLGRSANEVNAALHRLEAWLVAESEWVNADIELVEVKGTCLDLTFNFGGIESVRYGSFAKLPREAHRFNEWQATTTLALDELEGGKYDVQAEAEVAAISAADPSTAPSVKKCKKKIVAGSVKGTFITEDELACIPKYEKLYNQMTNGKNLKAGKFAVTAHDFAIALVLLRFFKKHANPDESLPTRRVGKMWTALYRAEDAVVRPWNHHRWKAIRDFLSKQGHIDWIDNHYYYGEIVDGEYVRGIACKFSITDEFASILDAGAATTSTTTGGASFVDTFFAGFLRLKGNGHPLVPERLPIRAEMERRFWKTAYEATETLWAA